MDPFLLRRQQQSQEGLQLRMVMSKLVAKVPTGQPVVIFYGKQCGRSYGWLVGRVSLFKASQMEECKGRLLG